jgi:hypothetical protein
MLLGRHKKVLRRGLSVSIRTKRMAILFYFGNFSELNDIEKHVEFPSCNWNLIL